MRNLINTLSKYKCQNYDQNRVVIEVKSEDNVSVIGNDTTESESDEIIEEFQKQIRNINNKLNDFENHLTKELKITKSKIKK